MAISRLLLVIAALLGVERVCSRVRPGDRDALFQLYELAGGRIWRANKNWRADGDPCAVSTRWVGVGCIDPCERWHDGPDCHLGRVTALALDANLLAGDISNWTLVGELQNLTVIDLSDNALRGALPTQIGKLRNLESLNVQRNYLEGTLPTELGQINAPAYAFHVREILAADNTVSGSLPSTLGLLAGLESLNLRSNKISGLLPAELAKLSALKVLHLHDNPSLAGTLPTAIGELTEINFLDVSRSRVSGTLPPGLGALQRLQALHAESVRLSGTIPSEICELGMLYTLRLGNNNLTGNLPDEIGRLRSLTYLDVYNNSMQGDVPTSIRNLYELRELYLANDHLLPLRKRYCSQRLPDLGRFNQVVVREEYDQMMATFCPEDQLHSIDYTWKSLQDSGVYEVD